MDAYRMELFGVSWPYRSAFGCTLLHTAADILVSNSAHCFSPGSSIQETLTPQGLIAFSDWMHIFSLKLAA
jgi:hypothetical protein